MHPPTDPTPVPPRGHQLALLYALFALVSTAVNIATQQLATVALAGPANAAPAPAPSLALSIGCGTAAGFAVKYVLDKRFIFLDSSARRRDEVRKVALYGLFGVFTTALFWVTETGALAMFGTAEARYGGAALGLAVGYALKYRLDRRFTFTGARA